ncbi:MAG: Com family DNA-binding transcriptional regulator [Alphaproteobacteria bacterium]|nr:Com family DNA-binding transcriptional regulator [Alphaproteobacteria bacterium]
MESIRCGCGRLLLKGRVHDIEIKCPRCRTVNRIRAPSPAPERQRASQETSDARPSKKPPS